MTTRTVKFRLYIAWNGASYVDESAYLEAASGTLRLAPPDQAGTSSRGQVDACTLTLANADRRFSPLNEDGDLYSELQNGGAYQRPMYLEVSIDNGSNYYRVFTGVIKLPQESTATLSQGGTVTIECRSLDELLLQRRWSTRLANMIYRIGHMEGDHIAGLLADISASTYYADHGVYPLAYAWLDDESVLDELWAMASACGGRVYCDPDGNLRYEDATHWLKSPHLTSQETFTRASFQTLSANYDDKDLYNVVSIETSPRQLGVRDTLWEPDEVVSVPPDSTKSITARFKQAAYVVDAPSFSASTSGGVDITSDVSITPTIYVQRAELEITNANTSYAAYLRPFKLVGVPLLGGPTQEEKRTTTADGTNSAWWTGRGDRTRTIRGNAYIQTRAQASSLAHFLLRRSENARLTWKLGGVAGVASRRLGDRVTINDAEIMTNTRTGWITAISWRLSLGGGFSQDIEIMDSAGVYPYEGEYFVLGTNKLGTTDPLKGVVFF